MGKVISGHTWNHPKISILRDGSSHVSLPGQFLPGRFLTSSPFHQGQLSPGALKLLALRDSHYSNVTTRVNFFLVPLGYFPLEDTQHCVTRRASKFMPEKRPKNQNHKSFHAHDMHKILPQFGPFSEEERFFGSKLAIF